MNTYTPLPQQTTVLKTIAVLLSLTGGCAGLEPTVYVDRRFSADEEAQIAEAAEALEVATGGALRVDLAFGAAAIGTRASRRHEIVRYTNDEAAASEFASIRDPRAMGYDQHGSEFEIIAMMPDRFGPYTLRSALMHELLHHFGLAHTTEPDSIMAPQWPAELDRFVTERCLGASDIRSLMAVDVDTSRAIECQPLPTSTGTTP